MDGLQGQQWVGVGGVGVLDFGAVGGGVPGMRGILWERRPGVLGLVQRFLKVIGHGNVASRSRLIPMNVETIEQGAGPIHGDGVLFLEGLDQVVSIFFAGIFDAKVVNDKGEGDVTRRMLPEGRGVGDRRISK